MNWYSDWKRPLMLSSQSSTSNTQSVTHSHSLTPWFTHSLTHSLTHTHSHIHIYTITHSLTHTLTHSLTRNHTITHTHTHNHSLIHTNALSHISFRINVYFGFEEYNGNVGSPFPSSHHQWRPITLRTHIDTERQSKCAGIPHLGGTTAQPPSTFGVPKLV